MDRENKKSVVRYADDFIAYGNLGGGEECLRLSSAEERLGLSYNEEKCGFIKKGGRWLKPLKFLGLTYNGATDKLYASTRAGASLEFDKQDLVQAVRARESSETSPGQRDTATGEEGDLT